MNVVGLALRQICWAEGNYCVADFIQMEDLLAGCADRVCKILKSFLFRIVLKNQLFYQ
jgi:hypothetical protein